MGKELVLIKVNNGFAYATDADREASASWKKGQAIRVLAVQQSARSLSYHQRYWAGLIALTFDYWEPSQGMTTEAETKLISKFCQWLDKNAGGGTDLQNWGHEFLTMLSQNRAQKIPAPHKTKEALHDWIKEQAGYFDVEITPTGPKRKLKSINFNAMSEEQFREYYKAAFSVCWRYVLAEPFDDEATAHNAISQLLSVE